MRVSARAVQVSGTYSRCVRLFFRFGELTMYLGDRRLRLGGCALRSSESALRGSERRHANYRIQRQRNEVSAPQKVNHDSQSETGSTSQDPARLLSPRHQEADLLQPHHMKSKLLFDRNESLGQLPAVVCRHSVLPFQKLSYGLRLDSDLNPAQACQ